MIYKYTVHNGYSDNGGDMEFLAKLSIYPICHYIQCISLNSLSLHLIYDFKYCQYIYFHKYKQISYRIQLVTIFIM